MPEPHSTTRRSLPRARGGLYPGLTRRRTPGFWYILIHYEKLLLALAGPACCCWRRKRWMRPPTARIRSEEMEHSQIMHIAHMLTDRYGPRVTGTPNHEAAAKWAVAQFTSGVSRTCHLEPWDFGHPGWQNERASASSFRRCKENLKFEVLAWTPSTNGTVTGSAIQLIVPPQGPLPPAPPATARRRPGAVGRGGRARRAGAAAAHQGRDAAVGRGQPRQSARQDRAGGQADGVPVDFNPPAEAARRTMQMKAQCTIPTIPTPGGADAAASAAAAAGAASRSQPPDAGRSAATRSTPCC